MSDRKITAIIYLVWILMSLSSCKDWTQVESLTINTSTVKKDNPNLYNAYLNDLKAYKEAPHPLVFAWFDNSRKVPGTQGDHVAACPDSLDYLILHHGANLVDRELAEMKTIQQDKGVKVLYEIDVNQITIS